MRWKRMVLIPVFASASVAWGDHKEAVVHTVDNWNGGVCSGSQRCWSNMTTAWYNEITNSKSAPAGHGSQAWSADGNYIDSFSKSRDSTFTDADLASYGADTSNDAIDDVDVAMVGMHGYNASSNNAWFGRVRIDEPGDGNCNAWQTEMELGESGGDAEFLHLSSCVSMDQEDWHPNWSSTFHGIHQIHGFHGVMYIFCSGYPDRYRDFADDSFYVPVALAWLDNMYDRRDGINNDQCPVSRAAGLGQADTLNRMFTERYNNVLSDPVNPTWHHVLYVGPCDPVAGDFLPIPE